MPKLEIKCYLKDENGKNVKFPISLEIAGKTVICRFAYFPPMLAEIKAMAGSQWNGDNRYWTIDNCKRNWYAFSILMRDSKVVEQYWSPQKHFDPAECLPRYATDPKPLWLHQADMYDFMLTRHRCICGAWMRTGKTRPTLHAFLASEHRIGWFITTNSAFEGIIKEGLKWFRDEIAIVENDIYYRPWDKKKVLVLMTYDKFTTIMQHWPVGKDPVGFVVFDELQRLKTPETQRTTAAMDLVYTYMENVYQGHEWVIGLSGTPAPKNPIDWWSECEVIRAGFIQEGSKKKFEWRIGEHDKDDLGYWQLTGYNREEVKKIAVRLTGLVKIYGSDTLDLPPPQYEIVRMEPSPELLRVAKFVVETEERAATVRTVLRQLSDGFRYEKGYDEKNNKVIRTGAEYVGSPKEEQLRKDLEENADHGRIVIYGAFKETLTIIRNVCLASGWDVLQLDGDGKVYYKPDGSSSDTREVVRLALDEMDRSTDTNTVEKLAIVGQTDSAGTGLEFSATRTIIYYSNSDNGEGRMQSEARGTSENMDKSLGGCIIKDYIHLPSDEKIRNTLLEKKDLQALSMGDFRELFAQYKTNNVEEVV